MYTEVLTFDPQENVLLMGHAAVHDPRLASPEGVTLVPDAEYRHSDRLEGAWQEFIMAEGPVTCVSLYDAGHGYRLTAFEGASLGGPRRLEGYAHALVCPDVHVLELLPRLVRRGMTQHFGVVPGRIASVLAKWCTLAGIEFRLEA
jgi:L-arabinose isomerase